MSRNVPIGCVPAPLNALISLVDISSNDCSRVLASNVDTTLLPLLRALGQPAIDVSDVYIEDEKRHAQEVILTKNLKSAFVALSAADYDSLNPLEEALMTEEYIAMCHQVITVPDYFYALLCASELVTSRFLSPGEIELQLSVFTEFDIQLFEIGISSPMPAGRIEMVDEYTYRVTLSDIDIPSSVDMPRGIVLGSGVIDEVIAPKENCRDYLHRKYNLFSEYREYAATLKTQASAMKPTERNTFYESMLFDGSALKGLLSDLIAKQGVTGYLITKDILTGHYAPPYGESSSVQAEVLVVRVYHPLFPQEECHVVFDEDEIEASNTVIMLKGTKISTDSVLFEDIDCIDKVTVSLLDAVHFIVSQSPLLSNPFGHASVR